MLHNYRFVIAIYSNNIFYYGVCFVLVKLKVLCYSVRHGHFRWLVKQFGVP